MPKFWSLPQFYILVLVTLLQGLTCTENARPMQDSGIPAKPPQKLITKHFPIPKSIKITESKCPSLMAQQQKLLESWDVCNPIFHLHRLQSQKPKKKLTKELLMNEEILLNQNPRVYSNPEKQHDLWTTPLTQHDWFLVRTWYFCIRQLPCSVSFGACSNRW